MKFLKDSDAKKVLNGDHLEGIGIDIELDENLFYIKRNVDEYPMENTFYSDDIHHEHFKCGWNAGHHYFSEYALTPWEHTSWGSKEKHDIDHAIPSEADYSQPVMVGKDIFDSIEGWHGSGESNLNAFYTKQLEKAAKGKRCYGRIVISSATSFAFKAITISYCERGGFIYKVTEFACIDELQAIYAEEQKIAKASEEAEALKRKEFARMCTRKARIYEIPFDIALAFKGDDEAIQNFIASLQKVIDEKIAVEFHELSCGRARNSAEMARLGIYTGCVDTNRINDYVSSCLKKGKVLQN